VAVRRRYAAGCGPRALSRFGRRRPAPFQGVRGLPISTIRSALPVLGNPLNRGRAKSLAFDAFRYGWTNAIESEDEAKRLYDEFHVPDAGKVLHDRLRWRTHRTQPDPRSSVDEYRLTVHPVALGAGLSLMHGLPEPQRLELISSTAYADGCVAQVLRPR
jgi:hypothetical protein